MASRGMSEFRADGTDYTINDPNIADEFSESTAYTIGDHVNRQGKLYRFKADHAAGEWNSSHVDRVFVGARIKAGEQEVSDLKSAFYINSPNYDYASGHISILPFDYEIGNINAGTSGWTYGDSTSRVRTKRGFTYHLTPGTVISFDSYTDVRFYVAWKMMNGTYSYEGWLTSDYTVKYEGDYVILITEVPETDITDKNALLSRLTITIEKSAKAEIENTVHNMEGLTAANKKSASMFGDYIDGYIDNSSGITVISNAHTRAAMKNICTAVEPMYIIPNPSYQITVAKYINGIYQNITSWINGILINKGEEFRFAIRELNNGSFTNISDFISMVNVFRPDNVSQQNEYLVPYELFDGYLDDQGRVTQQTANVEKYTSKINVKKYKDIMLKLDYVVANNMWFVFAEYGIDGTFIRRVTLSRADSAARNSFYKNLDFTDNTYFISVSFRTYGNDNYSFAAYCSNVPQNDFTKTINHRGYCTVAPENTLPAYKLSKLKGFDYVETDVQFTSDNIPVLIHNDTIDATSDGSGSVDEMTYEQLLQYDFGSWKASKYAGTKIPTFEQFIKLCKDIQLKPFVELKSYPTQAQVDILAGIVKKYHMEKNVYWFGRFKYLLEYVLNDIPDSNVGIVEESPTSSVISDAEDLKELTDNVFIAVGSGITTEVIISLGNKRIGLYQWTVDDIKDISSDTLSGIITNDLQLWKVLYYKNLM